MDSTEGVTLCWGQVLFQKTPHDAPRPSFPFFWEEFSFLSKIGLESKIILHKLKIKYPYMFSVSFKAAPYFWLIHKGQGQSEFLLTKVVPIPPAPKQVPLSMSKIPISPEGTGEWSLQLAH